MRQQLGILRMISQECWILELPIPRSWICAHFEQVWKTFLLIYYNFQSYNYSSITEILWLFVSWKFYIPRLSIFWRDGPPLHQNLKLSESKLYSFYLYFFEPVLIKLQAVLIYSKIYVGAKVIFLGSISRYIYMLDLFKLRFDIPIGIFPYYIICGYLKPWIIYRLKEYGKQFFFSKLDLHRLYQNRDFGVLNTMQ